MSAGRVVSIVAGSLLILVAIGLLLGGGSLLFLESMYADDEGFLSLNAITLRRDTFAITAPATIADDWAWMWMSPATLRVEARPGSPHGGIFVGVAPRDEVEAYLQGVPYAEIDEFRFGRGPGDAIEYHDRAGGSVPMAPASQSFWRAGVTGEGPQTLLWDIESGDWVLVAMNADGSRVVDISGSVGVKAPWLHGIGVGLLVAGLVLLALGATAGTLLAADPPAASKAPVAKLQIVPVAANPADPNVIEALLSDGKTKVQMGTTGLSNVSVGVPVALSGSTMDAKAPAKK